LLWSRFAPSIDCAVDGCRRRQRCDPPDGTKAPIPDLKQASLDETEPHYQRHLRVEHWANALNQGITAGHNAAGNRESYTRLPYFFSDQYDLGLEYVGHSTTGDAVTIRGDRDSRQFIAFWHHDGIITAAMNVNTWDVVDDLKTLIETRSPIDPALLTDLDTPIAELARLNVPEPTRKARFP
jgi:hypothetical protein